MTTQKTTDAKPADKKTWYATGHFHDTGTGRRVKSGAELTDLSEGEAINYEAAGLISATKPEAPAA